MSDIYTASGTPGVKAPLSSAAIRAEFAAIDAGLGAKFPSFAGNVGKFLRIGASAFEAIDSIDGINVGLNTPAAGKFTSVIGTDAEAFRINNSAGIFTGYDTAGTTKTGTLGFNVAASRVVLSADRSGFGIDFQTSGASRWQIDAGGALYPSLTNTFNIGGSTQRPATIYGVAADFSGIISSTSSESLRIVNNAGFISGYNAGNNARTGYLQFDVNGGAPLTRLTTENAAGAVDLVHNSAVLRWTSVDGLYPISGTADCGTTGNRFRNGWFSGTVTAPTFSGSGASLTNLPAGNLTGTVATARMGSGTADSTTFLRGDGTWQVPPASAVTSVFGRNGIVVKQSGDYAVADITGAAPLASPTFTGTASGSFSGPLAGNASTATALATARNINGTSFNGTADITVAAAAGTLTGGTLASGVTASSLTSVAAGCTVGGIPVGFAGIPRVTGGAVVGKCNVITGAFTVNTGPAAGDAYSLFNATGSSQTLTQGGGVTLRLAGTTTTGSLTIAPWGYVTIWPNTTSEMVAIGNVS